MLAIFKRELRSYLYSPLPYVLMGLFILLLSLGFTGFYNSMQASLDTNSINQLLGFAIIVLIFLVPVLTMRLFADERKHKIDILLTTSPVSITKVVLAKYLAAVVVVILITASTWIYPIIVGIYSKVIFSQLISGYLGFILLGAAAVAFGIFASSITENQIVAAVIGIAGSMVMWIFSSVQAIVGDKLYEFLQYVCVLDKFQAFQSGKFALTPVIYYLSFAALFVFLTIRAVEKRRWS